MLVCHIWGVDELHSLAVSPLGSVAYLLSLALYLLLKSRLTFPLVSIKGGGGGGDGGHNSGR